MVDYTERVSKRVRIAVNKKQKEFFNEFGVKLSFAKALDLLFDDYNIPKGEGFFNF